MALIATFNNNYFGTVMVSNLVISNVSSKQLSYLYLMHVMDKSSALISLQLPIVRRGGY